MALPATALHFPSAKVIEEHLSKDQDLNLDYFQEHGLTAVVVKLAAERFADKEKIEMGVKLGVDLIVLDLQRGKDGYTQKELPKFDGFDETVWVGISEFLKIALINCAKSAASK